MAGKQSRDDWDTGNTGMYGDDDWSEPAGSARQGNTASGNRSTGGRYNDDDWGEPSGEKRTTVKRYTYDPEEWHWDKGTFIASLLGGFFGVALAVLLNHLLLKGMTGSTALQQVLLIASVVFLTILGVFAGILVYGLVGHCRLKLRQLAGVWILIAVIVLPCLAGGAQYLYGLEEQESHVVQDYVFVIDDSSSMSATDPRNERLTAMKYLIPNMGSDQRVAVVIFTNTVDTVIPLTQMDDDGKEKILNAVDLLTSNGNTDIGGALQQALSIEGITDTDRTAQIVLLTDGEDSFATDAIIASCKKGNIIVSAIQMYDTSSMSQVNSVVQATGGTLYTVQDSQGLVNAYTSLASSTVKRDLLGIRTGEKRSSVALAALRIGTWTLIGALYGLCAMLAIDTNHRLKGVQLPLIDGAAGLFAGVTMEVLNWLRVDQQLFSMHATVLLVPLLFMLDTFWHGATYRTEIVNVEDEDGLSENGDGQANLGRKQDGRPDGDLKGNTFSS